VRILFVTSTRLGDAVLSTGLLDHLLRTHPEARFTIACGPVAEGVFARMPRRERTIVVAKRRFGAHWLALWAQLAATRWDLVVDLRGSALAWTLLTRQRAVMRGGRRPGHRILHLAEALGVKPAPRPVAWWGEAEAARGDPAAGHALDRPRAHRELGAQGVGAR
jgi:heptosyltransferase III